jgi:hypothetical protein
MHTGRPRPRSRGRKVAVACPDLTMTELFFRKQFYGSVATKTAHDPLAGPHLSGLRPGYDSIENREGYLTRGIRQLLLCSCTVLLHCGPAPPGRSPAGTEPLAVLARGHGAIGPGYQICCLPVSLTPGSLVCTTSHTRRRSQWQAGGPLARRRPLRLANLPTRTGKPEPGPEFEPQSLGSDSELLVVPPGP